MSKYSRSTIASSARRFIGQLANARPAVLLIAAISMMSLLLGLFQPLPAQAATKSLFETLAGRWTGWGWIELASGDRERIKCRISYRLIDTGSKATQGIRCASSSYNIDATALLWNDAGTIKGTWREVTYDAHGKVSGSATDTSASVNLESNNLNAAMKINSISKCRHTVSIRPKGIDIKMISVGLKGC